MGEKRSSARARRKKVRRHSHSDARASRWRSTARRRPTATPATTTRRWATLARGSCRRKRARPSPRSTRDRARRPRRGKRVCQARASHRCRRRRCLAPGRASRVAGRIGRSARRTSLRRRGIAAADGPRSKAADVRHMPRSPCRIWADRVGTEGPRPNPSSLKGHVDFQVSHLINGQSVIKIHREVRLFSPCFPGFLRPATTRDAVCRARRPKFVCAWSNVRRRRIALVGRGVRGTLSREARVLG